MPDPTYMPNGRNPLYSTCSVCHALVDQESTYQHTNWHASLAVEMAMSNEAARGMRNQVGAVEVAVHRLTQDFEVLGERVGGRRAFLQMARDLAAEEAL